GSLLQDLRDLVVAARARHARRGARGRPAPVLPRRLHAHHPRRSTGHVSTTSSPSTTCIRSWYATVGSTWAGATRIRSPTFTGDEGRNVMCSSETMNAW